MPIIVRSFRKTKAAEKDFPLTWDDWLDGDTIAASTWTVPAGLTKVSESFTANSSTVVVSGGTVDERYTLTCQIVTAYPRTDERSIEILIVP